MSYRKLKAEEVKELLGRFGASINKSKSDLAEIREYIKNYYPSTATTVLVQYNSEYNDEGYDVSVQYVAVYDREQQELLPLKDKAREARDKWAEVFFTESNDGCGFRDPVEDKVYLLNEAGLPELYIKE